jgi:hypothetical protein
MMISVSKAVSYKVISNLQHTSIEVRIRNESAPLKVASNQWPGFSRKPEEEDFWYCMRVLGGESPIEVR